jgi:hypothetical protein
MWAVLLGIGLGWAAPADYCDQFVPMWPADGETDVPTNIQPAIAGDLRSARTASQDLQVRIRIAPAHDPDGDTPHTEVRAITGITRLLPVAELEPNTGYSLVREVPHRGGWAYPCVVARFTTGEGPEELPPPRATVEVVQVPARRSSMTDLPEVCETYPTTLYVLLHGADRARIRRGDCETSYPRLVVSGTGLGLVELDLAATSEWSDATMYAHAGVGTEEGAPEVGTLDLRPEEWDPAGDSLAVVTPVSPTGQLGTSQTVSLAPARSGMPDFDGAVSALLGALWVGTFGLAGLAARVASGWFRLD